MLVFTQVNSGIGLSAMAIFSLGLLILLIDSVLLFRERKSWQAAVVLIGAVILFGCSWFPWYGPHGGDSPGRDIHRHSIWELGHVH